MKQEPTQILLGCLRRDHTILVNTLPALSRDEWNSLARVAARHRVRPLLYQLLKEFGADNLPAAKETVQSLKNYYLENTARNLSAIHEFTRLVAEMDAIAIQTLPLKGMYLANSVYKHVGLREMHDIDLLVPKDKITLAIQVLKRMGYGPQAYYTLEVDLKVAKHLTPFINQKTGLIVELHWSLTDPGHSYSVAENSFWEHAVPVFIAGVETMALSTEDLILHLCEHLSYQHQFLFGLRSIYDIVQTLSKFSETLNWEYFCKRAKELQWARGVFLTLSVAAVLFEIQVPEKVLTELQPPDFNKRFVETAIQRALISHGKSFAPFTTNFAQTISTGNWKKGFSSFLTPKENLAKIYSISPASPKILWFYLIRFFDLIQKYSTIVWTLWMNKNDSARATKQALALVNWLEKTTHENKR